MQLNSFNLEADTPEILTLQQLQEIAKSGSFSIGNIQYAHSLSMMIPDPQTPHPSAFLVDSEETPQNKEGVPYVPEPVDEGDIQMEYSSDQLHSPSIVAVTKHYL